MGAGSVNQIELEFGDGTYLFKLGLAQIAELQEKCGAGIGLIFKRVMIGEHRIEDCVETIRLGLVGGGMNAVEARRLVDRYTTLSSFSVKDAFVHATAILTTCVVGYDPPDESKKKPTEPSDPKT